MSQRDWTVPYDESSIGTTGVHSEQQLGACVLCQKGPARSVSFMYVMSFLLLTRHAQYEAMLCRSCSTRQAIKELVRSALLGWWGVPWGLLTLQALWINGRSLVRWSTLPAAFALILPLAGLALPVAAGYFLFSDLPASSSGAGGGGGDRVSDEVYDLVQRGHDQYAAGDYEAALGTYLEAHRRASDSGVINFQIAQVQADLGAFDEALPYAARAEELDPMDVGSRALHGWLLAAAGDWEGAEEKAAAVEGMPVAGLADLRWMQGLAFFMDDWQELLRLSQQGQRLDPHDSYYPGAELLALVCLDRLEEADARIESLSAASLAEPVTLHARQLLDMQRRPREGMRELLDRWRVEEVGEDEMARFVVATERAGHLAQARRSVRAFLHDPTTPASAWSAASPWFDDATLVSELDAYLSRRPETEPAMLRLATLDPLRDRARLIDLADRMRRTAEESAPLFESLYLYHSILEQPRSRLEAWLRGYLSERPESPAAKLKLLGFLVEEDPVKARRYLAELRREAASGELGDAEIERVLSVLEGELLLVENEPRKALALLRGIDLGGLESYVDEGRARLVVAEAEFRLGGRGAALKELRAIQRLGDVDANAASYLLLWALQAASGEPVGYQAGARQWLAELGDSGVQTNSTTGAAILLLEGRADEEWHRLTVGDHRPETLRLVSCLRQASLDGSLDREELGAIARSPHPHDFASRLARVILAQLS